MIKICAMFVVLALAALITGCATMPEATESNWMEKLRHNLIQTRVYATWEGVDLVIQSSSGDKLRHKNNWTPGAIEAARIIREFYLTEQVQISDLRAACITKSTNGPEIQKRPGWAKSFGLMISEDGVVVGPDHNSIDPDDTVVIIIRFTPKE